MDFIEKIFGMAPDGGSGTLEALMFVIPMMGLYFLYLGSLRLRRDK
jgi:hypothetical protein